LRGGREGWREGGMEGGRGGGCPLAYTGHRLNVCASWCEKKRVERKGGETTKEESEKGRGKGMEDAGKPRVHITAVWRK